MSYYYIDNRWREYLKYLNEISFKNEYIQLNRQEIIKYDKRVKALINNLKYIIKYLYKNNEIQKVFEEMKLKILERKMIKNMKKMMHCEILFMTWYEQKIKNKMKKIFEDMKLKILEKKMIKKMKKMIHCELLYVINPTLNSISLINKKIGKVKLMLSIKAC